MSRWGEGFPRIITSTGPKREKEVVLSNCLWTPLLSTVGMVSHFLLNGCSAIGSYDHPLPPPATATNTILEKYTFSTRNCVFNEIRQGNS